ncbi:acyltransferase family protein [Kineococcus auxinigenes]|uniref:acyltransferase family protein n=1 Tax=unclassified Kineococcus TaxID=2621656 RepID=UPI003D7C7991
MDERRDAAVETLRGLACVLLVLFHVRGDDATSGLRLGPENPWSYVVDSVAYLRMPLFTFLSGFVYAARPNRGPVGSFTRGKVRRLLVPMLVIGTVFAVLQQVSGHRAGGSGGTPWYLWHVLPVAHFWFLVAVFWVFLVVAALDRRGLLQRPAAAAGAFAASAAAHLTVPSVPDVLGLRSALYLAPFFLAGLAARRFSWQSAPRWLKVAVVAVAVAGAALTQAGLLGVVERTPVRGAVAVVLGAAGCLSLLLLRWRFRPLVLVGAFSFTVYTCHVFATSGTRTLLYAAGIEAVTVHVLAGTASGLTFGVLVELLARRRPWPAFLLLGQRLPSPAPTRT